MSSGQRVAVIGAGWAGLAAAVQCVSDGHQVTLHEMARVAGGRARSTQHDHRWIDNGHHILIGAYVQTLNLMRRVGVDVDQALLRLPLSLIQPDGSGLRLPAGTPLASLVRGLWQHKGWSAWERLSLLAQASAWGAVGFRCSQNTTVSQLCRHLSPRLRADLLYPLCIAALNTEPDVASASMFLRVLRDALLGRTGSSDLLLPCVPLAHLLPEPAWAWLADHGADLRSGSRVVSLDRTPAQEGWLVNGEVHDGVILACSANESARLAEPFAPSWASLARTIEHEPIVTVMLGCPSARLPAPMVSLPQGPAQFVFDHGQAGDQPGHFSFVISAARRWVEAGLEQTGRAVLAQARQAFADSTWPQELEVLGVRAERRATFRASCGLQRPGMALLPGLVAAGDYVAGPYPSTLEGAVQSGGLAARSVTRS